MTVRKTVDKITTNIKSQQQALQKLPREAYDFWVKATPIRSGNARRSTRLTGETIVADYPYAERLDDGWSRQAPNGMSEPTEDFIDRRLRSIMRKR